MAIELGVIITNRNRPEPLRNCLLSLAVQKISPKWVVIADLGSALEPALALRRLANEYGVSYLEINFAHPWSQAPAFNTALRHMPAVSHVVQLDADMILHPDLLELTHHALTRRQAFSCAASYALEGENLKRYEGSLASYCRLLCSSWRGVPWARGGYMVLPRDWLVASRGMDESFVGWGYRDADLWWRAKRELTSFAETTGSLVIHQPHPRQPGASTLTGNYNWEIFSRRLRGESFEVNPSSFGEAPVTNALIRTGIRPASTVLREETSDLEAGVRRETLRWMFTGPLEEVVRDRRVQDEGPVAPTQAGWPRVDGTSRFAVSVVALMRERPVGYEPSAVSHLLNQTLPPSEVLLVDCRTPASQEADLECGQRSSHVRYIRCASNGNSDSQLAMECAIRESAPNSTHILVLEGDMILHPRALELLRLTQSGGRRFVHGYAHCIPRMAAELDLIESVPWRTWWSVAYLADLRSDNWYLTPRDWITKAIERRSGTLSLAGSSATPCAWAHLSCDIEALCLGPRWVLAFRYPEQGGLDSEPDHDGCTGSR
jgi:hypothetical protein